MRILDASPGDTDHVVLSGINKTYDGNALVVCDLNLSIRKGEFLTLLGPSGSGKTTTLMMVAGFEYPTAGEMLIAGALKPAAGKPITSHTIKGNPR